MNTENSPARLEEVLAEISQQGIRADCKHLLEDIGSQFSDYREWIREYVVNASDAGATWCRVLGREDDDQISIYIWDNGHGMDEQGVGDFLTLFRSVKEGDSRLAVGRFGVGKACILAIPDLVGLSMATSTGTEAWKMQIGSFLDAKPIHVQRVEPAGEPGTRFSITFKKKITLDQEMHRLGDILYTYVRYLPMTITIQNAKAGENGFPSFRHINDKWSVYGERLGRKYTFSLNGSSYDAILGLGQDVHEIYQNRVMVTARYNLFCHDLGRNIATPGISVRVDSPDFELPFGRHGLRNEEVLIPLSRHLRKTILPDYFDELHEMYLNSSPVNTFINIVEIEDLVCALLVYDSGAGCRWSHFPVFTVWGHPRLSIVELRKLVDEAGRIYLEDPDNVGADYTAFDAPVISMTQPQGGLKFLKEMFAAELLNLGSKDLVLEQPLSSGKKLSWSELNFESFLGFRPELLAKFRPDTEREIDEISLYALSAADDSQDIISRLSENSGLSSEARHARTDLEEIVWRVNYLVERDGVSPCLSQKFLYKDETVILNLHHPEVRKLLLLSEKLPSLSGHWAMAMCLEDRKKILNHLTPEAREDLIRLDAMVRGYVPAEAVKRKPQTQARTNMGTKFNEYLRSLSQFSGMSSGMTH